MTAKFARVGPHGLAQALNVLFALNVAQRIQRIHTTDVIQRMGTTSSLLNDAQRIHATPDVIRRIGTTSSLFWDFSANSGWMTEAGGSPKYDLAQALAQAWRRGQQSLQ